MSSPEIQKQRLKMQEIKKGNYWHIHDEGMPVSPLDAYRVLYDSMPEKEARQRLKKYYIHEDDLLWYWEYQDENNQWLKSEFRARRDEIQRLSNYRNFTILYALGFRIGEA